MAKDIFARLFARFVESIHIELPYEAINVPVPKVFGQNGRLELLNILNSELLSIC
jgi:hypothetical protein